MSTIRFDDALPTMVATLKERLNADELKAGVIVRDVVGRMAFILGTPLDAKDFQDLSKAVSHAMGPYARIDNSVILGVRDDKLKLPILNDPSAIVIREGGVEVRFIDRRLSGVDWLRPTLEPKEGGPPVVVYVSMKGGVGRTTSLVVSALDLLETGRRVLVLDLDLEAPGLGVMLLEDDELPLFGALDALVERKLGPLDDKFLQDLVASSSLGGGGLLVCPAIGIRSLANPSNVLSKIGRIYGEVSTPKDAPMTVMDQVAELVSGLVRIHKPDVILVDARAGLHELTAAAILGLGSEVLLFGLDEPQTWHSYKILLAQLAVVSPNDSWSDALTAVQGRAPADPEAREAFKASWREMITESKSKAIDSKKAGSAANPAPTLPADQYVWAVPANPSDFTDATELVDEINVIAVMNSANFSGFAPLKYGDHMNDVLRKATFGELFKHIRNVVGVT